jgi:hypothetical protein
MLKREDIKNGTFVLDRNENTYTYLQDVGNAREKGDRGCSTTPEDEPSYSIVDIITGEVHEGICEHSGYNDSLDVAATRDIDIYLAIKEADSIKKLGKAKKQNAIIQDAVNRFEKMKIKLAENK